MRNMKGVMLIGILLIVLGALTITFDQVAYKRREKLFDVGPVEATVTKEARSFRMPIIFGAIAVVAGIYLVWVQARSR